MTEAMDDDRFRAPDVVVENMQSNQIGISTGKGFFDYANVDIDAYRKQKLADFLRMFEHLGHFRPPVI
jgi:3-hydroxybutyryl-CoA dehydrogenase